MNAALTIWAVAFLWTLAIELPVYALCLRRALPSRHGPLLAALAVNIATHPAFSWWAFTTLPQATGIVGAECLIVAIEGSLLAIGCRRLSWRAAMLAAGLANLASYGLGLLLFP